MIDFKKKSEESATGRTLSSPTLQNIPQVKELIVDGKVQPGSISYGTIAPGSLIDSSQPNWVGDSGVGADPQVAVATQPSAGNFREDAGDRTEFLPNERKIPFVKSLQDGSPQVKPREEKYIQGAEAGMFFNSVTGKLWPGKPGIIVIPCYYSMSYTEWKPSRGGFVADHGKSPAILSNTKKGGNNNREDILPSGNVIQTAAKYFAFIYDEQEDDIDEVVFSFPGTGLTFSRGWNSLIGAVKDRDEKGVYTPADYFMSYRINTFLDKDHSEDFFNYQVNLYKKTVDLGPSGMNIYLKAKRFRSLILAGLVTASPEETETPQDRRSDDSW